MTNYNSLYQEYRNYLVSKNHRIDEFTEFKFESIYDGFSKNSMNSILNWYEKHVANSTMEIKKIPLKECIGWYNNGNDITHESGEFFKIEAYDVKGTSTREVASGWQQPFITQVGYDGGILGLIRKRINDVPHYLVEAKEEPGNYNIVQISTTLQATYSNLKRAHKGSQTRYIEFFNGTSKHESKEIFKQYMSEDGGRLMNKRNYSILVELESNINLKENDRYIWVTLKQIKDLIIKNNAIVAPHLRGILSAL